MDISKKFGTSEKLENEGVWVDLGDGAQILVARAGNKENRELIKRLIAPHKVQLRHNKLPDEVLTKLTIEAMSTTILLDWKGIEENGKTVAYNRDNAIRLLTDYKDFRDQVSGFSNEMELFQAEEKAAITKN